MVLPLNLALTPAEISAEKNLSHPIAYMACSFSPYTHGLSGIPPALPEGSMLILNDRMSCQGHSPDLVAGQLQEAVTRMDCESVLLDFQRPRSLESEAMVGTIVKSLPCPVAVTGEFAAGLDCPVLLSPAPLHIPIQEHLSAWQGREIWLEAALGQSTILVTREGFTAASQFPSDSLSGGFYEEVLCCHYRTEVNKDCIRFTLFDTVESLERKLELAHSLGVKRAVGLYQELGDFRTM